MRCLGCTMRQGLGGSRAGPGIGFWGGYNCNGVERVLPSIGVLSRSCDLFVHLLFARALVAWKFLL